MLAALGRIAAKHPDGRVLVVTHGGSMRRVQTEALGFAMPVVENCGALERMEAEAEQYWSTRTS